MSSLPVEEQEFTIRQMIGNFPAQLRRNVLSLLIVYGSAIAILALVYVLGNRPTSKFSVGDLLRDPAQVAGLPFYIGCISNLGVLCWAAGAGICLLTAAVLKRVNPADVAARRFFLLAGLLTALLVCDDLFMIHEEAGPKYLFSKKSFLHVKEGVFFIAYFVFALTFLWRCRSTIQQRTDSALFFLSLLCLALSIAADKAGLKHIVSSREARFFIEDGFKFLGIAGWTLYFSRSAIQVIQQAFRMTASSQVPA
ncbi:MAG: hypothetical protein ACR2IE_13750 [Candidatus Sumerlaeaceae bacterium]